MRNCTHLVLALVDHSSLGAQLPSRLIGDLSELAVVNGPGVAGDVDIFRAKKANSFLAGLQRPSVGPFSIDCSIALGLGDHTIQ